MERETFIVYRTTFGAEWLGAMPFAAKGEDAWALQIEAFDRCQADDKILDCTLHAEASGLAERLGEWTTAELNSPAIWRQARAMMVRGFLGFPSQPIDDRPDPLDIRASWLGGVWLKADEWRERRDASAYWVNQMAASQDLVAAAANMELVKLCADRRTWLLLDQALLSEAAKTVFARQWRSLKASIEKREKDMSERFLGDKLIEGVWPRASRIASCVLPRSNSG